VRKINKINELRHKSGLKQKDFCKLFGISQSTLSEWENEKYNIPTKHLKNISIHFNVTTDYLLGVGEIIQSPDPPQSGTSTSA
jgi:transcriptional regulator with XRE-family HTH domain